MVCLLLPARAAPPASAAPAATTFTVNWLLDEPDAATGDDVCLSTPSAKCTLRAAVQQANVTPGHDTIVLGPGFYILNRPGDDNTGVSGDLDIHSDLTIRGAGLGLTTIFMDAAATGDRAIQVHSGVARLEGVTVRGGDREGGGGIYSDNRLTVTHSSLHNNNARYSGGGLANLGIARLDNNSFTSNRAQLFYGGAIYNTANGSILMHNSTLSANRTGDAGSAIFNAGSVNAYNVTIAYNRAGTQGVFSGNEAGLVNDGGALNIRNAIVANNYYVSGADVLTDDCHGTLGVFGAEYFTPLTVSPTPRRAPWLAPV